MMRMLRGNLFGAVVLVLSTAMAFAQATAELNGRVTDESGAVLPGVTVTATQTDTGLTRAVVSDETGGYTVSSLPVGPYRLEFSLQGFRTAVQTGIVLQVNTNPTLNATLELGDLTETISVEASAGLIETRNPGIGIVVDNERVVELPLNGRQARPRIHDRHGGAERHAQRRARRHRGRRLARHDRGGRRPAEWHRLPARRRAPGVQGRNHGESRQSRRDAEQP